MLEIQLFILIGVANGTPIIARIIAGPRLKFPVDCNKAFVDKRPLFGTSKTILGLTSSLLVTTLCAYGFGFSLLFGALIACCAMIGDLLSSFIKRRLNFPPSTSIPGLDQIPEALLPMLLAKQTLELNWISIFIVITAFMVFNLIISHFIYKKKTPNSPH